MLDTGVYNEEHWVKKIQGYEAEEWSSQSSPFAWLVAKHLHPHSRILELGTGAGQDGLWFATEGHDVTLTDATDEAFERIQGKARAAQVSVEIKQLDVTSPFPFASESFDVVYAQLVLHYFTDAEMHEIFAEIQRVLVPGGIVACMVNSTADPEYDPAQADDQQGIPGKIYKRYFGVDTFAPFVRNFEPVVSDARGRTRKDDAVGTVGMVQFVGRKHE
jgi:SAM-dependent methyltransferase